MTDVANQLRADARSAEIASLEAQIDALEPPVAQPGEKAFREVGRSSSGGVTVEVETDSAAERIAKDAGQGIVETPAAIVSGAAKGANEALDLIDELGDNLANAVGGPGYIDGEGFRWFAPGEWGEAQARAKAAGQSTDFIGGYRLGQIVPEPDSNTGKFVEGVSQFLTGFFTGGRALRGVKASGAAGAAAKAGAQGALADFAFFDGQEANLSALIEGTPLANPVTEFLAIGEETPELVGRLKRAAEGVGLGMVADGLLTALRALRAARKAKPAGVGPAEVKRASEAASVAQYRELSGDEAQPFIRKWPSQQERSAAGERGKLADAERDLENRGTAIIADPEDRVGLNMARVSAPEDVAKLITGTEDLNQDALARAIGYRSWAEADAASGGIDAYRLLMERQAGRGFTDAEALAARKLNLSAWAAVRNAAAAHKAGATPATAAALREAWTKAYAIHKELLGARADAARALAVWRMGVSADEGTLARQMEAAFSQGGKETADEIAARVLSLDPMKDVEGAMRFLEKSALARTRDMVAEAYQAALLSSPKTQMVNVIGNSATIAWTIAERAVAGRLSRLLGADDGVAMGEAAHMAFGATQGLRDAMRYVARIVAAGGDVDARAAARGELLQMTGRRDENFQPSITARNVGAEDASFVGSVVNGLGALVRLPGNAMAFSDDLFKLVNHRAELYAQASRIAQREVADGAPTEGVAARIAALVDDPTPELLDAARRAAEERTFTTPPGTGARIALSARRAMNEATPLPIGTMLLPFVNTPANILGFTFRRTPLAPLFKKYRDAVAAGGAEADLANAQMAMGTFTLLLMMDMAQSGQITGAEPVEASQRELWRRAGIQPYSVKVGDKWVGYNRVEPLGTVMSIGADLGQLWSETPFESDDERQADLGEAFAGSAGAIGSMSLNKTYLTSVGGLVEYLSDPTRYGEGYLSGLIGPVFAPNIVRDIERIQDPYLREGANIVDRVRSRIPGASESLPIRVDLWGDPVENVSDMGPVYDAVIPIPIRGDKVQPIDRELLRLRADISMPSKEITYDGVKVGLRNRPDIYNDYVRTAAQGVRLPKYGDRTMREHLNLLVSGQIDESELYQAKLDTRGITQSRKDDEKVDVIHKIMDDYREAAREIVKEKYARDLQALADQKRRSLEEIR